MRFANIPNLTTNARLRGRATRYAVFKARRQSEEKLRLQLLEQELDEMLAHAEAEFDKGQFRATPIEHALPQGYREAASCALRGSLE
eukprot:2177499-Alexandrium_andersonii.AAC.1